MRLSALSAALGLALLCIILTSTTTYAHNITRILAKHPEFSIFNEYLTKTHLAGDINRRQTITVLAIDNAAMSSLTSKGLSLYTIKNVLSLHVLVDYFGSKKLHQITNGTSLTATMFQATGSAPGNSGYVNITDLKGGKVGFGAEDNDGKLNAVYVKSLHELPYNISVLQISQPLTSEVAEAPTPEPSQLNLTAILHKKGCKAFADLLVATKVDETFETNIDGGLTVFCPSDPVMNAFMPKYKNLTATQKASLLLYHGVPVYQSMQMLKSNNGVMNTLATDGANKFDFTVQNDGDVVTLKTKIVTAKLSGTLLDEEPLVVYKINKVLMPKELFKKAETPAPAPAPEAEAPSPKAEKDLADGPDADAPEGDDAADQTADNNGAVGLEGGRFVMAMLSLIVGVMMLM